MQKMEELRDMLCKELDKITKKGELSAGSLDIVDKLTHSIKSIDTIMAMEEAEYSNDGYSYARGRRRDSMGRYSREGSYAMNNRLNNRGGYRGYSRDEEIDDLRDHLEQMKQGMQDEESKHMVSMWIKQMDNM